MRFAINYLSKNEKIKSVEKENKSFNIKDRI
jgi:hypothetical protein